MTTARLALLLGFSWTVATTSLVLLRPVPSPHTSLPSPPSSDPLALAAEVLRRTDRFASVAVGAAGITSIQALAWRVVFQSPAADSVFKELIVDASRPGQLYALAGLFLTDSATYARAAAYHRFLGGEVATHFGCLWGQQEVAAILDAMDRGDWTREFLVARPQLLTGFRRIESR